MKNFKFSRLFAALMVAACLVFVGCDPVTNEKITRVDNYIIVRPLEADDGIVGTWESNFGEKYVISTTEYDNYSHYDSSYSYDAENWYLYYSTSNPFVAVINDSTGILFSKYDDEEHIGFGAAKGQWYAFHYKKLTDGSVSISQAYKDGGKTACDTLKEAVKEFTIDNGYFGSYSECVRK